MLFEVILSRMIFKLKSKQQRSIKSWPMRAPIAYMRSFRALRNTYINNNVKTRTTYSLALFIWTCFESAPRMSWKSDFCPRVGWLGNFLHTLSLNWNNFNMWEMSVYFYCILKIESIYADKKVKFNSAPLFSLLGGKRLNSRLHTYTQDQINVVIHGGCICAQRSVYNSIGGRFFNEGWTKRQHASAIVSARWKKKIHNTPNICARSH